MADNGHLAECIACFEDNRLVLENNRIRVRYLWNEKGLCLQSIEDKLNALSFASKATVPDAWFPSDAPPANPSLRVTTVDGNGFTHAHMVASFEYGQGALSVRREFRIQPDAQAITSTPLVKGTVADPSLWKAKDLEVLTNIEELENLQQSNMQVPRLAALEPMHRHWRYRAITLYDITDLNNNLVEELTGLLYLRLKQLPGSLLFLEEVDGPTSVFILKGSPYTYTAIGYPGFDFAVNVRRVFAVGVGILASDVNPEQWTPCYPVTLGICGKDAVSRMSAVKEWALGRRKRRPDRDSIVLMNTWGDRSKGDKLGEEFCLSEIEAAHELGISHFQIDAGWADTPHGLTPDPGKFPRGLAPLAERCEELGITLGLWFTPGEYGPYTNWRALADSLLELYREYDIRAFKVDLVNVLSCDDRESLRRLYDAVVRESDGEIVLNLDVTAKARYGLHSFLEYGNFFLENRYTDWHNYYPHWTLRNLWMLSSYVPTQILQVEFLNPTRNRECYPRGDHFAPGNIPFEYMFAATMVAQPLAWFEGSNLPAECRTISWAIKTYRQHQARIHSGIVHPIGSEPDGASWCGFQSVSGNTGYVVVYRERYETPRRSMQLHIPGGTRVKLEAILGSGASFSAVTSDDGKLEFELPTPFSYALYSYEITS